MLTVDAITCVKQYRCLFSDLSFTLKAGEIVQLEGANGAGKTSLLRILTGFARPETGQVLFHGSPITQDPQLYHEQLLYIGHKPAIHPQLTALQNVAFWQATHVVEPGHCHYELLANLGLVGLEDVPVQQLSAGQQRRVALTRLWHSQAALWLLDEPFTAVDKTGVKLLQQRFMQHLAQGGAILLTSHQDLTEHFSQLRTIKLEYQL